MVLGGKRIGCDTGVPELIGRHFLGGRRLVADAEGFHPAVASVFAHGGEDRAGIESTAQKHPEWNLGEQAHADTFVEQFTEPLQQIFRRAGLGRRIVDVPVF